MSLPDPIIRIGKLVSSSIGSVKNAAQGAKNRRLLKVGIGADLQHTAQLMPGVGIDANPPDGTVVAMLESAGGLKVAVSSWDGIEPSGINKGEVQIYATNNGSSVKCTLTLNDDGSIVFDVNPAVSHPIKYLVTYTELNSALQNLITALNAHVHTSAAPGSPTTPPVPPTLSVDITSAKAPLLQVNS